MPSLKDVKMKIVGVGKTKQITKAMNMVASAKLRGAQARIERFRPYAGKYRQVLAELARKVEGTAHPLLAEHEEKKKLRHRAGHVRSWSVRQLQRQHHHHGPEARC